MFDVGWPELFVIAAVALIAIGPKQLPEAMHKLGKLAGRFRAMSQGWRSALDRLAYEADLSEFNKKTAAEKKPPDQPLPPN
jgi:sec-independent protein translocase protein TatB